MNSPWPSTPEEVWRRLSNELSGELRGESYDDMSVAVRVEPWTITLNTVTRGTSTYGRHTSLVASARYVCRDGFQFKIGREGLWSRLWAKLFGRRNIEVGHPDLDRDFIITGNDESKVRALFASPRMRELFVQSQPPFHLIVLSQPVLEVLLGKPRRSFPQGVYELLSHGEGNLSIITDGERLKALYELFAETLHQLHRIGSASEEDPRVEV